MTSPPNYPGLLGGRRVPIITWGYERALESVDATVQRLREWGIRVPPGSRLLQSRDAIRRVPLLNVQLGRGDPTTERMYAEAHRTVFELGLITQALEPPTLETATALRKVLRGPLVPIPGRHDPARDVQAEFFAGAILFACGFRVDVAEPDLLLTNQQLRLAAAIKRVTRSANFQKRIREARDQLAKARRAGFIVVVADQFLEEIYAADRTANLKEAHYNQVARWIDRLSLQREANPVIGLIGLSTSLVHVSGTGSGMQLNLYFHQRFVTWQDSDQLRAAQNVGEALGRALADKLETMLRPA